ncbi:MAG TPA: UDP-N-acetylmuramoyl-tripeptide--D-alanyl-D-alanine ligase [Pontiella sp.]|nr:UDP-N-acetylmuramoyl-tripeptide--D-alanyl-D-alanine ligase [Pontiella sp.]
MWKNGVPERMVTGVSHDTRTLKPGELYVAIIGEQFDGHAFVADAFAKGAAGALVSDGFEWTDHPVLQVPDTIAGLQDLARGYRRTWTGVPVGITGSVGKTTVKEMCADVLSVKAETHRTAGNYNNHIGLPLTMLSMPPSARYGVFELGMNHPGEIAMLSDLLEPEMAVLTDICNAHREHFPSLQAIAFEKSKLAERVPASGLVILDRDSEWYTRMCDSIRAEVVSVSFEGMADYMGRPAGDRIMNVNGHDYSMPLPGEHIMRNALRVIALASEIGMTPEEISEGMAAFNAPPMRWQQMELNGIQFINDAYNANPLSMRASLSTFSRLPDGGGKWAVVGGMRELGDTAAEEHAALGRFIDGLALDGVIAVGELARPITSENTDAFFHCADADGAAAILRERLKAGDHVLLKASRGERLERVINFFKEM